MKCRTTHSFALLTGLLAAGCISVVPDASSAAPSGLAANTRSEVAKSDVIEIRQRRRRTKIHLPAGPAYLTYDYPYYYARGHYPYSIGGYVYYPRQFSSYPALGARCFDHHRSCFAGERRSKKPGSARRKRP